MDSKTKALAWIKYSENDLGVALHLNETYRPLPENAICWHCQQSVEKSYKAILAYHDVKIPKTHEIRKLQRTTLQYEPTVSLDEKIADKITEFATESRYPDNVVDFTKEDAELGIKYAKQVLGQVKQALNITEEKQPPDNQTTE
jgi:HEPN domain-containing protein